MTPNQLLFFVDIAFLLVMSLLAIVFYMKDKGLAIKGAMRIQEKTLLFFAVFGGAIGSFLGRKIAHHKTDKIYFSIVILFSLVLQVATATLLAYLAYLK